MFSQAAVMRLAVGAAALLGNAARCAAFQVMKVGGGNSTNSGHGVISARKPVFFLHIHKAAGNLMCEVAVSNHEGTPRKKSVCAWETHDTIHSYQRPVEPVSCARRRLYDAKHNITFQEIEREMWAEEYCPEMFVYATLLRDPISLLESFLNFFSFDKAVFTHRRWKQSVVSGLNCVLNGTACPGEKRPRADTPFVHFDNFMVRMLGGIDVLRLPPGGVNATHAQMALNMLRRFDMVATVEDIGTAHFRDQLRQTLGWQDLTMLDKHFNTRQFWYPKTHLSEKERERLREINRHDYALFNFARAH